jgi:cellulose synthase/poly-beta-1,6-N-acetylglucosamine synthase-like glycosyltransferase
LLLIWLFLAISFIYFVIATSLARVKSKHPRRDLDFSPFVSVIVCARNEETTMGACLDSLLAQSYQEDLFEVVAVDDRSSDSTPEVLQSYQKRHPELKVVTVTEEPKELTGKQVAMDAGIKEASGEIVMTTDADCVVPPHWIRETVKYFSPPVGMVAGFSHCGFDSLFSGVQSCDHIFLEGVASAFANLGSPQSCIGNNLSFRRDLYQRLGGFGGIGFTVTEDTALMQKISAETTSEVLFPQNRDTLVLCEAAKSLGDFFRQRKRWLLGGMKTRMATLAVVITAFLRNLLFVLSPLFLLFQIDLVPLICAWMFTLAADLLLLLKFRELLVVKKLLTYYLPFQLFYPFYTTALGLSVIFGKRKIHWKGREYAPE